MKIRALLFALACSLAASPAVRAADTETELELKMEKLSGAFRALRRQVAVPAKNPDSLAKVATIRQQAEAALKHEPAMKKDVPADKQAKFVADYQAEMKKFLDLCGKLEAALKANNNEEANKLCGAMADMQKSSHKTFKKDGK